MKKWDRRSWIKAVWANFRFLSRPLDTIARRSPRASHWFTQDPETGDCDISGHIQEPDENRVFLSSSNHGGYHWRKCQERGIPLQAALVIGAPPPVCYTAPARIPV